MSRLTKNFLFVIWLVLLGSLLATIRRKLIDAVQNHVSSFDVQQPIEASNTPIPVAIHLQNQAEGSLQTPLAGPKDPALPSATIAMVTMLYGDNAAYEQALQSHADHAESHGYGLKVLRQKLLGRLWSKPAYILSIILNELQKSETERLQWLFWFDADTVIINSKIPIEIFLPPAPRFDHIHFLCGYDHNGLNDGAFLLRVNDYSLHLMAAALTVESFKPNVDLRYSEQSAIEHIVTSNDFVRPWENFTYAQGFVKIPQRWFNAYMGPRTPEGVVKPKKQLGENSVREGDMLVHFAGSGETKQKRMIKFLKALKKDKKPWTVDLKDTEYEAEISDFWRGLLNAQDKVVGHDDQINISKSVEPMIAQATNENQLMVEDSTLKTELPPILKQRDERMIVDLASITTQLEQPPSSTISTDPNLRLITWNGWEVMPGKIRSEKFRKPKVGYAGR